MVVTSKIRIHTYIKFFVCICVNYLSVNLIHQKFNDDTTKISEEGLAPVAIINFLNKLNVGINKYITTNTHTQQHSPMMLEDSCMKNLISGVNFCQQSATR